MSLQRKRENAFSDEATIITHDVANATYTIVGNNGTSDVGSAGFNVETLILTRAWYGCGNAAFWTVKRGANTVAVFSGSGEQDFDAAAIDVDSTGTLVLTLNGGTNGFIVLEGKLKQTAE